MVWCIREVGTGYLGEEDIPTIVFLFTVTVFLLYTGYY